MFPSRSLVLACLPFFAAAGLPALAADEAPEQERLAALVRQLDLAEHLAQGAAQAAAPGRARYRFDYPRLRDDLARVRAGIQDYLVPARAQPRDLSPLIAHYKTSQARPRPEEAP
jgi:RAQPRD family integrative conjugative element protein